MRGVVVTEQPISAHARAAQIPRPLAAFVGRRSEVRSVQDELAAARLVCLTGQGGCGKTRLAIEVAQTFELAQSIEDARLATEGAPAVCWVDLEPVSDAADMARALANAVGIREAPGQPLLDSVIGSLADTARLLVLDNCEHLLPSCAETIYRLLTECPAVRVLATSREVLGVAGEVVWRVPSLTTPEPNQVLSVTELLEYESVQLFCARAKVVQNQFTVDESKAEPLARICRSLDGLPLAIELAAARVRVLSVAEIAAALENRLALLSTAGHAPIDRHRSLRAVLDWSHRLLTEPEGRLLAELSVFTGGFGLDAARAVHLAGPDEPDAFDLVARLVDRSLVSAVADDARTRYSLSETVRLYASEHLLRSGETADTMQRLVTWCVEFGESVENELFGSGQPQCLDRLELERGNVSAAMRFALAEDGNAEDGLRIVAALWRFWSLRGYYTEGRLWAEAALAATSDGWTAMPLRARALVAAANLAYLQCAYGTASERLEDALALYRAMSDHRGVAKVLQSLGSVARECGRYEASLGLHNESLDLSRQLGNAEGVARASNYLSLLAWLQQDLSTATALAGEALTQYRSTGDSEGIASSLINLAASALYGGQFDRAAEYLTESLSRSRAIGYREGIAWSLNLSGVLAIALGRPERARRELREALREHWALGDSWRTASVLEALAVVDAELDADGAAQTLAAAKGLRTSIGAPAPPVERALLARATDLVHTRRVSGGEREALRRAVALDVGHVIEKVLSEDVAEPAVPEPAQVHLRIPVLTISALGASRVQVDDTVLAAGDFGYAKPRELLYYLLDRGDATKDQIGAALWPWTSASRLRSSFHTTLHHLRSALPGQRVIFRDGRYCFDRTLPYSYDVETFEQIVARSRGAGANAANLAAAVDLYRGDYLAELIGERWIDERRQELRRTYERALSDLAGLRADAGLYDDAIDILHRAVTHDPLSETAHRELMRCYAVIGRRASALKQYQALRDVLREELSTSPAPETAELVARIRRGELSELQR